MTPRAPNKLSPFPMMRIIASLAVEIIFGSGCGGQSVPPRVPRAERDNFKVLETSQDTEVILRGKTSDIALMDRGQSILAGPVEIFGEPLQCVMSPSGMSAIVVTAAPEDDAGRSEYGIFTLNKKRGGRLVDTVFRRRDYTHIPPDPDLDAVISQGDTGVFVIIWGIMNPLEKYIGIEIAAVDSNGTSNDKRVRVDGDALGLKTLIGNSDRWYLAFLRAAASDSKLLIVCSLSVLSGDFDRDELVIALTMSTDLVVVSRSLVVSDEANTRSFVRDLVKKAEIRYCTPENAFCFEKPLLLRPLDAGK